MEADPEMIDSDMTDTDTEDANSTVESSEDGGSRSKKVAKSNGNRRGCTCKHISSTLLVRLDRTGARASTIYSDDEYVSALRTIIGTVPQGDRLKHAYFLHLKILGGRFGLQVKHLKLKQLRLRLRAIWNHRGALDQFKTRPDRLDWFRLRGRPQVEDDERGIYSQRVRLSSIFRRPTPEHLALIVDEIGGNGAWETWKRDGNILIQDLFGWLWVGVEYNGMSEAGIKKEIDNEFDMYLYHQRESNGTSNKGWLRMMFFSFDPADHQTRPGILDVVCGIEARRQP